MNVPSRSQSLVVGSIGERGFEGEEVIFKPREIESKGKGILVGRCLNKIEGRKIIIPVVNLS